MLGIMVLMANEEGRDLMDIKFCIVYDEGEARKCDASSFFCSMYLKRFQQTIYWLGYESEAALARQQTGSNRIINSVIIIIRF